MMEISNESEYLNSLKDGERVMETGQSMLTGKTGTVYHNQQGHVCVMWDSIEGSKMGTSATHGTRRISDVLDAARRSVELEAKVHACEVGKPYSSRGDEQSHKDQIAYLKDRCGKAAVTYRCDCGMEMNGPYDPTDWPCSKCKTGKLIPEPLRRIAELEAEIKRLQTDRDDHAKNRAILAADLISLSRREPVQTLLAENVAKEIKRLDERLLTVESMLENLRDR